MRWVNSTGWMQLNPDYRRITNRFGQRNVWATLGQMGYVGGIQGEDSSMIALFALFWVHVFAFTPETMASGWQEPPAPIPDILDASGPPSLTLSPDNHWMVEMTRPSLPSVGQLAEPVVRIAGLQLNPKTRERARTYGYTQLSVRTLGERASREISLPEGASINNLSWSRDSKYLAFTNTEDNGVSLWVLEMESMTARQLTEPVLNQTYGRACSWVSPTAGLICKVRPAGQGDAPTAPDVAPGPMIEENIGRATPARTYTNLLQNPHDEALFEYYLTSDLVAVGLDGTQAVLFPSALILSASPSPDGTHVLVQQTHRPFSYHVPVSRFPRKMSLHTADGAEVKVLADLPLADSIPIAFGSVRTGPRSVGWRSDAPATLSWVEALDDGDAKKEVTHRDALMVSSAPFTDEPTVLWKSSLRYGGVMWGHESFAMVEEWWYDTRTVRLWSIDPSGDAAPALLHERNYQDAYADPGSPMMKPGPHGAWVLHMTEAGHLLLRGVARRMQGCIHSSMPLIRKQKKRVAYGRRKTRTMKPSRA